MAETARGAAPGTTAAIAAVQAGINEYWTGRADGYSEFQDGQFANDDIRAAWERAWSTALPAAPADVLDVGCGTGHVARLFAHLGHRVTGIDLADGMVAQARDVVGADPAPAVVPVIQTGDAVNPDFADASFDAVTARYVLWTLRESEVALANWRRILRPGGTLAIVDSMWFPEGISTSDAEASPDQFHEAYDENAIELLPLAEATTIDPTVDVVRRAGFDNVTVTPLEELLDLDRRYGVAPNHRPQLQYLITGTA